MDFVDGFLWRPFFLQKGKAVIQLFLLELQLAKFLHIVKVAQIRLSELHVPDLVLVLVRLKRLGVLPIELLLGVHVFSPGVVNSCKVLLALHIWIDRDDD